MHILSLADSINFASSFIGRFMGGNVTAIFVQSGFVLV